jgi:hypothetical protein
MKTNNLVNLFSLKTTYIFPFILERRQEACECRLNLFQGLTGISPESSESHVPACETVHIYDM